MPYIFHLQSMPFSAGKQSSNARDHPSSSSESDIDKLEEKAQKDMEERDALSKRIRDREKQNVRHIVSKVSPHMAWSNTNTVFLSFRSFLQTLFPSYIASRNITYC